jgi:hypothetical protein
MEDDALAPTTDISGPYCKWRIRPVRTQFGAQKEMCIIHNSGTVYWDRSIRIQTLQVELVAIY